MGNGSSQGADDRTVRVWDAQSGLELLYMGGHDGKVEDVAYSADGSRIVSVADDDVVILWDAHTGACLDEVRRTRDLRAVAGPLTSAVAQGRWLATEMPPWKPLFGQTV